MWPSRIDTQELIAEAQAGSKEVIDELFTRHREALRRLVALRLDPAIAARVDASDIVQETLIEANRRFSEYLRGDRMPFHLWLRRIALDRLIDAHRRHRVAERRSVDRERPLHAVGAVDRSSVELSNLLRDPYLTPAAAAMKAELSVRFQEMLGFLSEPDREILTMRHFEELTNQEAAQALDLSEPAAAMRYMRALRRLRALLEGGSGEESEEDS